MRVPVSPCKGSQHPDCRHVHDGIPVRRRNVPCALLIKRPVGVPLTTFITGVRHHTGGVGDTDVFSEKGLAQTQQTRLGEIWSEGLIDVDQTGHFVQRAAWIRQLVCGRGVKNAVSHLRDVIGWDDRFDHAPAILFDTMLQIIQCHRIDLSILCPGSKGRSPLLTDKNLFVKDRATPTAPCIRVGADVLDVSEADVGAPDPVSGARHDNGDVIGVQGSRSIRVFT